MSRKFILSLAVSVLAATAACKSSPNKEPPPPAAEVLPPMASAAGLPVRHFYVHEELKPGTVVETGEGFTMNGGDEDGHLFLVAADALRSKIVVKETDGTTHEITPRSDVYIEPNFVRSPSLRAVCATAVTVIDRGKAPFGHAYAYDEPKGSRLLCWVNPANGPKSTWYEIEVASSVGEPDKDMYWSFAMTASRTEPNFDVVYARDAEWTPQLYHSVGRKDREKGYERTITLREGKPVMDALADGAFPDFSGLHIVEASPETCGGRCGWVWESATWIECGGCGSGEACIGGTCAAGKTCTPKTKEAVCDALACGKFGDGCGGRIDCGEACTDGLSCGADGTYRKCGRREAPRTADEIRSAYGDKDKQLCGVFLDPQNSVQVDLGPCGADQKCENNLCDPYRAAVPVDAGN